MPRRDAAFFLKEFSPHVDPVETQDRPFEYVRPRQLVATQRTMKFDDKGADADHLREEKTQVNSKNFLTLRVHQSEG